MVTHIFGCIALLYYPVLASITLASFFVYQFIVRSELRTRGYDDHNAFRKITRFRQFNRCLSKLPHKSVKEIIVRRFLVYERFVLRNTLLTLSGGIFFVGIAFALSIVGI
jgi:hypothetical protein